MTEAIDSNTPGDVPPDLPEDIHISYKPGQSSLLSRIASRADVPIANLDALEKQGRLTMWSVADPKSPGRQHEAAPVHQEQFILRQVIGRGGFGEIWEATQTSLGRTIAVKRMRDDLFDNTVNTPSTVKQVEISFRQEALTTAVLDHPNIVPVHDLGIDDRGRTLLAMKLVRGTSWENMLEVDWRELSEPEYYAKHLPILIQVCQAVSFAHSRGVAHRDLKPSQVIVGQFGEVTLMDWGLAVVFDLDRMVVECSKSPLTAMAPTLDSAVNPAGTIAFMAPEQTEKTARNLGPWTDIFLLGGTLYYIMTGTVPHRAPGNVVAFYKAMQGVYEPPAKRAPHREIPDDLAELCASAMKANRDDRLKSVKDFIAGLENYLSGANKKNESLRFTEQVEETLRMRLPNYEDLARCMVRIERANALWPRNPNCERLLNEVAERFGTLALKNQDLRLARLQAERMSEGDRKEALLHRVEEKENRVREAARVRVQLKWAAIIFGVLLVGSILKYYVDQEGARAKLEESNTKLLSALDDARVEREKALTEAKRAATAREKAEAARSQSEQLVNFLVGDLSKELMSIGRVSVMEKVTTELSTYYSKRTPGEGDTARSLENEGLALGILAGVQGAQGRLEASKQSLERSRQIAEELFRSDPDHAAYKLQLAKANAGLGNYNRFAGRLDDALQQCSVAVEILNSLVESDAGNSEYKSALGASLLTISAVYYELGEWAKAKQRYRETLDIYEGLVRQDPANRDWAANLSAAYDGTTVIYWQNDQISEALEAQARSLALREQLVHDEPWNSSLQDLIVSNYHLTGVILFDDARFDEALEAYNSAMEGTLKLEAYDPDLRIRKLLIASLHSQIGAVYREKGELDLARVHMSKARGLLAELLEIDASNSEASLEMAYCHLQMGLVLRDADIEAARREWNLAIQSIESSITDPAKAKTRSLSVYARALLLLDRVNDARPIVALLAARQTRFRDLYEICYEKGLVREPAIRYRLELK